MGGRVSSHRFSIIITCHNQRDFIQAAVDSALSQNPTLLADIVVVDDGSTDGSPGLLDAYQNSIQLQVNPTNLGAVEARNQGARLAHGAYLVFLRWGRRAKAVGFGRLRTHHRRTSY